VEKKLFSKSFMNKKLSNSSKKEKKERKKEKKGRGRRRACRGFRATMLGCTIAGGQGVVAVSAHAHR
jgi:hypothetical protein